MQISGLHNAAQTYQSLRAVQQNQGQVPQPNSKVNQTTQPASSLDPDHDGDIDGKGKDIDVRV